MDSGSRVGENGAGVNQHPQEPTRAHRSGRCRKWRKRGEKTKSRRRTTVEFLRERPRQAGQPKTAQAKINQSEKSVFEAGRVAPSPHRSGFGVALRTPGTLLLERLCRSAAPRIARSPRRGSYRNFARPTSPLRSAFHESPPDFRKRRTSTNPCRVPPLANRRAVASAEKPRDETETSPQISSLSDGKSRAKRM